MQVGDSLLLVVPRGTNRGQDHAPAVVTHVNTDGTVDVHAHGRGPVRAVKVHTSRASVDSHLEQAASAAFASRGPLNPQTDEEWHPSDVAHWEAHAYPHTLPETADEKAAREAAERATRAAKLRAELAALETD